MAAGYLRYFSMPLLILAATLTGSHYRPGLTVEKLSSGKISNVHRVQTAESTVGTQVSVASRSVFFPFCSTAVFPGSWRQPRSKDCIFLCSWQEQRAPLRAVY